jgi:hypothetical protein
MAVASISSRPAFSTRRTLLRLGNKVQRRSSRCYRLIDENSVLQFLPHSGGDAAMNHTNTKVQNAKTATQPDTTIVMSSLSACLSHLRICALLGEPADDTASLRAFALQFIHGQADIGSCPLVKAGPSGRAVKRYRAADVAATAAFTPVATQQIPDR